MGGTVAVTIRMEDGTEYRMHRWTNALPWFYNNVRLFEKDPAHIEEYLSQWRKMKDDWDRNHATGNFQFNMTNCYSPYPAPLAPCSYGIVVFDFMKNVIVNCQGYTSFDNAAAAFPRQDPERVDAQVEMFKAGRIQRAFTRDSAGQIEHELPASAEEFRSQFLSVGRKFEWLNFKYDTSPFVLHQFPDDITGWQESKKVILDLGFKLSNEDESAWAEHYKYYE